MTTTERVALATRHKDAGNDAFKAKNLEDALHEYSEVCTGHGVVPVVVLTTKRLQSSVISMLMCQHRRSATFVALALLRVRLLRYALVNLCGLVASSRELSNGDVLCTDSLWLCGRARWRRTSKRSSCPLR